MWQIYRFLVCNLFVQIGFFFFPWHSAFGRPGILKLISNKLDLQSLMLYFGLVNAAWRLNTERVEITNCVHYHISCKNSVVYSFLKVSTYASFQSMVLKMLSNFTRDQRNHKKHYALLLLIITTDKIQRPLLSLFEVFI